MDCLHAQQLLSEAHDCEIVDATRLAEAKEHCGTCPECTAFARGLLALRAPGPTAPESLIATIVGALEAEAAQQAAAEAAEKAVALAVEAQPPGGAPGGAGAAGANARRPRPTGWRAGWGIAAAAAVVIGFALLTQYGIGLMSDPFGTAEDAAERVVTDYAPSGQPQTSGAPTAESRDSVHGSYADTSKAPAYVVFRDSVYRLQGAREASSAPTVIGSLATARDGSGAPSQVNVYADPANPTGLLLPGEGPDDAYVAFAPVTRSFKGRTYALSTDTDVGRFGEWPRLPAEYAEPASADGSPIFFESGTDDTGVKVFAPRGSSADDGFAVAPFMPPTDASSGNPYWTWWEPAF